jgi:HlyD family secretion protein
VERRDNVVSVPNDAVRPPRDIEAAAAALGLNPDEVRKQVQAQFTGGPGGGANGDRVTISRGDVVLDGSNDAAQQGRMQQMPAPTAAECAEVRAALDKKPELRARLDSLRAARVAGGGDAQQLRESMRAVYSELGVDARVAMGCARAQRGAADSAGQRPNLRGEAPESPAPRNGGRRGLVFVAKGATFEPRIVALGIANYDYTEVISGVTEGEQVAVITAAALQQARQERLERFRGMTGGGVPGMQRQQSGGGGGGQRGGGGR